MQRGARARTDQDEVRHRILAVAEDMFRRLGYQKTAVSDIAAELGMSPANIYRFFASKAAINEAICDRMLGEALDIAFAEARRPGPPPERLRRLLVAMHRHHRETLLKERRMHDMVAVALEEKWATIDGYVERIRTIIEGLIREGVATGDFAVSDPRTAAECVKKGFSAFAHPKMIEECRDDDVDGKARAMAAFLVGALAPRSG